MKAKKKAYHIFEIEGLAILWSLFHKNITLIRLPLNTVNDDFDNFVVLLFNEYFDCGVIMYANSLLPIKTTDIKLTSNWHLYRVFYVILTSQKNIKLM